MSANNKQIGGAHYQSEYQHWDFVQRTLQGRYLEGCITKYVSRWRKKNGLQDLQKAAHYFTKLVEEFGARRIMPIGFNTVVFEDASLFSAANKLGAYESTIIACIATWSDARTLLNAQTALKELIEGVELVEVTSDTTEQGAGATECCDRMRSALADALMFARWNQIPNDEVVAEWSALIPNEIYEPKG
jgi:hypothetical protein